MKDDRPYLEHIHESIERIRSYTAKGWDAFIDNPMAQDAVVRNFEIIGEATKRLSDASKQRHPDIPWRQIAGFRDVLIHDYMGVNLRRVWNVVEHNLPALQAAVDDLLRDA
ncbi:MAG: DUF86 domain-containing protein [Phycisphaeraceae bacterium]